MPNRYVREDAIESERVNKLSYMAEVFYRRLINRVDDFGRFTANRELLRAAIFPLKLQDVSSQDINSLILECEMAGLLSSWTQDDRQYLVMHTWEQGRAKHSKYPAPPQSIIDKLSAFVYRCSQGVTNVPDTDSDSDPDSITDTDTEVVKLEIGSWFKRRPETKWSSKEIKALKALMPVDEDDMALLKARYAGPNPSKFRRQEILTLLNNWRGECDRQRGEILKPIQKQKHL